MESSSQDRTLPASERKLQQARKDGQIPRSRDLGHLAVLGVGSATLLAMLPTMAERLKLALAQALRFDAQTIQHPEQVLQRLQGATTDGLVSSLGFSAVVMAATVLSSLAVGGWVIATKPVTPDLSRVSPLAGFGRLFSKQHLADVVKLIVVSVLVIAVSVLYLRGSVHEITALAMQPSVASLRHLADWITAGMTLMLLVIAGVAVVDVPLQRLLHLSRLKMSHEEAKQENKESNGNPQIRARQRARAREIANRNSVAQVPQADFVVMNPTHYAVALRYDEANMRAPQVVSKGSDLLAMKIREIATNHGVPVLQSPVLARALYAHADLNREIPADLFGAVAQVLAYVYRVKAALRGEGVMPDAQPDPPIPPELDPHNPASKSGAPAAA